MTTKTTRPRSTKKFKALIAAGLSETDAFAVMGVDDKFAVNLPNETQPDAIAQLVEAGFTQEQAEKILADRDGDDAGEGKSKKGKSKKGKKAKAKVKAPEPLSKKDEEAALVASKGLAFTSGRVYMNGAITEAVVRCIKTGRTEIVMSSGVGRTAAVLVSQVESGDVFVQNLRKPV